MFKIVFFAIERIAEPISNQIEKVASRSPTFQRACIRLSERLQQDNNRKWALTGGSNWVPPVVESQKAVTMGCEMLGEAIVWSVGLGIVTYQLREEALAEEVQDQKLRDMCQQLDTLTSKMHSMEKTQRQLLQVIEQQQEEKREERRRQDHLKSGGGGGGGGGGAATPTLLTCIIS
jgi:hypothetical protein